MRAAFHARHILLYYIIPVMFGEEYGVGFVSESGCSFIVTEVNYRNKMINAHNPSLLCLLPSSSVLELNGVT